MYEAGGWVCPRPRGGTHTHHDVFNLVADSPIRRTVHSANMSQRGRSTGWCKFAKRMCVCVCGSTYQKPPHTLLQSKQIPSVLEHTNNNTKQVWSKCETWNSIKSNQYNYTGETKVAAIASACKLSNSTMWTKLTKLWQHTHTHIPSTKTQSHTQIIINFKCKYLSDEERPLARESIAKKLLKKRQLEKSQNENTDNRILPPTHTHTDTMPDQHNRHTGVIHKRHDRSRILPGNIFAAQTKNSFEN